MDEITIIERLRKRAGKPRSIVLGIGDDCAIYRPQPGEDLVFTTDFLIEDVHFRQSTHKPEDCGWKALARGLSDIAAMGATPRFCLISLAVPGDDKWISRFYDGVFELARPTKTALAGGDLSHSDKIVCDVVVCGSVPQGAALRRDTAKAGDAIYVSGALGASALGLQKGRGPAFRHHLRPEPRLKVGQALREKYKATAAMDLSDGLSMDLRRLAKASGLAADLTGDLPMFTGATVEQALHGGEDYEILFTLPSEVRVPPSIARIPVTRIGSMRRGEPGEVRIAEFYLQPLGYDHFRKPTR